MNWFAMSRDPDIKDIMGLNCPSSTVLVPLFPLMLEVRSCHFASVKLILDVTAGDRDKTVLSMSRCNPKDQPYFPQAASDANPFWYSFHALDTRHQVINGSPARERRHPPIKPRATISVESPRAVN